MAYDQARLEQALINADKAGDVEAAKMLAAEIRNMRAQPKDTPSLMDVATGPATMGDWAKGRISDIKSLGDASTWQNLGKIGRASCRERV